MRSKLIVSAALLASALTVAAAPMVANAQPSHRHRVLVCGASQHAKNTGTVVGAVTGGLLGNAVSHGGGKTGGTLIGAGVGAVAGHEIARQNGKQHCHYEYR